MICHLKLAIVVILFINQGVAYAKLVNSEHNPFFKRFHQVSFDPSLSEQHHRAQRSVDSPQRVVRFRLETHGKTFDVELYPSEEKLFGTDHVKIDGRLYPISSVQFYEGKIVGQEGSRVTGSIIEGAFVGTIETESDGVYHVEPAAKYKEADQSAARSSVVFHSDDIILDDEEALRRVKRSSGDNVDHQLPVGCALNKREVREKLHSIQQHLTKQSGHKRDIAMPLSKKESESYKYSEEANENVKKRRKRQSSNSFPNGNSECGLFLRIDWPMYQAVFNNQGKRNAETTAAYLINFLRTQVSGLNTIFSSISTYTGDNSLLNYLGYISFQVEETVINTRDSCNTSSVGYSGLSTAERLLCKQYTDEITMLNDVSMDNYDQYCLSYTFTSRDFSNGALGLAWTGAQGSLGGACTKNTNVNGNLMSLNTAIVTNRLYGSFRPDSATILTFAHEIGHSLGASHDSSSVCAPGGSAGFFIMYFKALSNSQTNNNRFSSCSIASMNSFLTYITGTADNCFSEVSLCGNGILDEGEACEFSIDPTCCSSTCTLNTGVQCSWSAGPCCTTSCTFQPTTYVCSTGQDCLTNVTCTNNSSTCPTTSQSFFVANNTPCNQNTQVCINGVCQGSICSAFGLTQCFLSGSSYDAATLCHIACTGASTNNQCTDLFTTTGSVYQLLAGSPCNNSFGYCDNYRVCRETDLNVRYNRLLSKFNRLLVSPLSTIGDWIQTYWWAVLLIVIGILIINVILVLVLWAVFKTDNPHKRKAYKIADILKKKSGGSSSKKNSSGKRVPREALHDESNAADEADLTPPDSRASSQTQLQPTTSKKSLV